MDASPDTRVARLAAAIAEPARARMLCCLMDGHARTATELAVVGEIGAPTASAHLARLKHEALVESLAQGRHRYYRLAGADVSHALEALLVLAGTPRVPFEPATPSRWRAARTCYDHMAGTFAVRLHDHLLQRRWLLPRGDDYELSRTGEAALAAWGVDVAAARQRRRRFACRCLDWSERRPHLAGALGAALLQMALARRWVETNADDRGLRITRRGEAALGQAATPSSTAQPPRAPRTERRT
jgi:DNA-binding transcriptional ArsR family regulator